MNKQELSERFDSWVRKSDLPYEDWDMVENGFEVYVSEEDAEELGLNTTEKYSFGDILDQLDLFEKVYSGEFTDYSYNEEGMTFFTPSGQKTFKYEELIHD